MLLNKLAQIPPEFYLPKLSWIGPAIKQYLPTEVAWTDATAKASALKRTKTTLNEDHYRTISPETEIYWAWPNLDEVDLELLDDLVSRILYFGRAESLTQIKRIQSLPPNPGIKCRLSPGVTKDHVPVLCPIPGQDLNFDILFATTEDPKIKNFEIPPGTTWLYAKLPERPKISSSLKKNTEHPKNLNLLQFAIGGRVLPPKKRWVVVTDRFRGMVLRERFKQITGLDQISFSSLSSEQKIEVSLLSGKDADDHPLVDHRHAFFSIIPDEDSQPVRLVVWRETPFTPDEIDAFLKASQRDIFWDYSTPKWPLRIIPLPFNMVPPESFSNRPHRVWVSLTSLVLPVARKRFRKSGRERLGETPEMIASRLLEKKGLPNPKSIEILSIDNQWIDRRNSEEMYQLKSEWVSVHRSFKARRKNRDNLERNGALGYYLRLNFEEPINGPIIIGESSHFGLGLFVPEPL
jgi:CRISPR-associated protein Csb2